MPHHAIGALCYATLLYPLCVPMLIYKCKWLQIRKADGNETKQFCNETSPVFHGAIPKSDVDTTVELDVPLDFTKSHLDNFMLPVGRDMQHKTGMIVVQINKKCIYALIFV